jgi:soluble P-type ATPase
MSLEVEIPGRATLELRHLLLDQNGTLSDRGSLIDGVAQRIARLRGRLDVHLLSADTFGTLDVLQRELDVEASRVADGAEKRHLVHALGPAACVAIGNGNNDVAMLEAAALGIAVIGPEGASPRALVAADVACRSVLEALELLLDVRLLVATLRS